METAALRKPRGSEIPAAPLARLINEWIESFPTEYGDQNSRASTPVTILCERVWPGQDSAVTIRNIYRILNESPYISFDLADRIIVLGFGRPELWLTDPELAEAYANVDLTTADVAQPTSFKVEVEVARRAVAILDEQGKGAVSRELCIHLKTVNSRIDRWRELAA